MQIDWRRLTAISIGPRRAGLRRPSGISAPDVIILGSETERRGESEGKNVQEEAGEEMHERIHGSKTLRDLIEA